ncbi:aldose 1-epimerase family protein [Labilibaculum sp. A4]|uniref:aldose 1-epimerase family protein n=1 Tax=Labilibaculum euxinus TaxID=2686357 RepID=UPI000F61E61A|nr:aldose 1-epimerase family protein [Labilibaculum euxinus]MDQ1771181.1 aldose 1-epimerase family protein [Labilibaculum euxinus]MWN76812.1 aldose 1-epimerase family protein [Labilibaculum euxinus]
MKYSIQNEFFQIEVLEKGAELCSIKSRLTNQEFIWQADPEIWGSHAPNLFPVIGCLKDDGFIHEGKEYAMPKHGFIRNNKDIQLHSKSENELCFVLKSNENTRKLYPFKFEFYIHYILDGKKLHVKHDVVNTGSKDMLFCLGGHPAFACPLKEGEKYSDYYLEFEQKETAHTWMIVDNGLIGQEGKLILDENDRIELAPDLFAKDALIFKNLKSSFVKLRSKNSNFSLKVSLDDFPYLGLWAKPNAPYVCIEPWIGIADSYDSSREFSEKEIIQSLDSGQTFSAAYSIEITE